MGFIPDHGLHLGLTDDDHPQYYDLDRLTSWYASQSHPVQDHGALTGLLDDDHTQYLKSASHTDAGHDHGGFGGLADDDHTQYLNVARHDADDHSGLGGWGTWVPSFTNITVGNGTYLARYIDIGGLVIARFRLDLGSTSSIGTSPKITMPVSASAAGSDANGPPYGPAILKDAGGQRFHGTVFPGDDTEFGVNLFKKESTSNFSHTDEVTATIPFTWGSSDVLSFTATYESA